jgi:molybdopterin converting factor small subunit
MGGVRLEILAWLSRYFGVESSGRVVLEREVTQGTTVGDLLAELISQNRELRDVCFDPQSGRPTGHVTFVLNGRFLELAGGLEAELSPGDTIRLMPTLGGG